jgi:hypothetical protein
MLWIILAAQLSLPVAIGVPIPDVRVIFSPDDMPGYVQSAGITRFVSTRTTIRPDGAPQDCAAERSSGDAKLDLYTCAIILKRAKFEPAKWVDGSPAYAIVRAPVTWAVAGEPSESEVEKAYPPDMTLTVNQLPAGAGKRVKLGLMLAVNESGRIVGCDQRLPASRDVHARTFPELLPIACQQLTGRFTALAAKDGSGMAVRSVQTASVVFSTGA